MEMTKQNLQPLAPVQSAAFLANVRKAEHLIAAGEYELALQRLADAQNFEPQNEYLPALIQRVTYLRNTAGQNSRPAAKAESPPAESDHIIDSRVKRLTVVATNLFERGSYEPAFQSLVKAFLLAPMHPHVVECQKTLQPAIRLLKERGSVIGLDIVHGTAVQPGDSSRAVFVGENEAPILDASSGPGLPPRQNHMARVMPALHESRLEILKRQKERERSERERAMWREASGPLKVYGQRIDSIGENNETPSLKESVKPQTGFFAKLKQGRFLG
jgi:hypothetical protein